MKGTRLSPDYARRASEEKTTREPDKKSGNTVTIVKFGLLLLALGLIVPPLLPVMAIIGALLYMKKCPTGEHPSPLSGKKGPKLTFWEQQEDDFLFDEADNTPDFSFGGDDHQHITVTGISREKRLEQLKVHYAAGLYTREQYLEARRRILTSPIPTEEE